MDIITRLNWVDLLVIIILFRISYVAFQDGLSHEIFPLIGTACTLVLSLHYYHDIALFINQSAPGLPLKLLDFVCFVLLVVIIGLLFKLARLFVDTIIKVTWHPLLEKFGGLLAGIFKGALVVSIVLAMMALIPLPYLQRSIRDRSLTGLYFLSIGPAIYGKVSGVLPRIKVNIAKVKKEEVIQGLASDKKLDSKEGLSR